jgi:hypothetical protein
MSASETYEQLIKTSQFEESNVQVLQHNHPSYILVGTTKTLVLYITDSHM